jgi:hypothetical protein
VLRLTDHWYLAASHLPSSNHWVLLPSSLWSFMIIQTCYITHFYKPCKYSHLTYLGCAQGISKHTLW